MRGWELKRITGIHHIYMQKKSGKRDVSVSSSGSRQYATQNWSAKAFDESCGNR
jgi:hypothetical protein